LWLYSCSVYHLLNFIVKWLWVMWAEAFMAYVSYPVTLKHVEASITSMLKLCQYVAGISLLSWYFTRLSIKKFIL
jgi:hypothetical protein